MPIKNPFKKTFKQKREALGVTREFNDTRTNLVGGMRVKADSKQANPKIRKIETTSLKKLNELDNKLLKLAAFKPKNEMEARKRDEAVYLIKEKIRNTEYAKTNALNVVSKERKQEREKRQEKIIEKKLLSILKSSPEYKRNASSLAKRETSTSKYNPSELRKSYQYFLETSGKTFVDLTINDVQKIFNSAVKNTKK